MESVQPVREPREPLPERGRRWAKRHPRATIGILAGLGALAVLAGFLSFYLTTFEHTDDAQVDGHIAAVSARLNATVLRVLVDDNQRVKKGQLVVELDPRDFQVAIERAEANLLLARSQLRSEDPRYSITTTTQQTQVTTSAQESATARAQLAGAERDREAALARLKQAQANATRASADLARDRYLVGERAISQQRYDQRVAEAKATAAEVDSDKALLKAAEKVVAQQAERLRQTVARERATASNAPQEVDASRASVAARQAAVKAAQADVDQARLNLEYTRIVAPFDGIVGKRSAEPGNRVSPGEELLAIVDVNDLWVTANFKETQLRRMRPGQPAKVKVDAFRRSYAAWVESLGAASGARFSLLPPENATGNYVKVVQRLPVRIRLRPDQPGLEQLRPGMSVEPRVRLE
jgi:membrane fusion protein (multidrug efflux system)